MTVENASPEDGAKPEEDDAEKPCPYREFAVRIIRDEHLGFVTALQALHRHLEPALKRQVAPNYDLFGTIFSYLDSFMERVHHPKEDEHLFRAVRLRTDRANEVLLDLQHEHAIGPAMRKDLHEALRSTRGGSAPEIENFARLLTIYTTSQEEHVRNEAFLLIPIAVETLTEADWKVVGDAFRENRDPLFGPDAKVNID